MADLHGPCWKTMSAIFFSTSVSFLRPALHDPVDVLAERPPARKPDDELPIRLCAPQAPVAGDTGPVVGADDNRASSWRLQVFHSFGGEQGDDRNAKGGQLIGLPWTVRRHVDREAQLQGLPDRGGVLLRGRVVCVGKSKSITV